MKGKTARSFAPIFVIVFALFSPLALNSYGQVTERPRTTPTPQPTVTPSPMPAVPIQTIQSLQSKIRQRLFSPEVRRGRVGVKIVSLNSGKVLFENDSDKYFMPASNMKNFTVATAIERLGPDFRFRTGVFAASPIDGNGLIKGPLVIRGGGDVSISNAFDPAFPGTVNPYFGIDRLVEKIVSAGVKRIEGDLIGDESYFQGFALPLTWEWDDLQSYYGTEISALPLNDNAVDVNVSPGSVGSPCVTKLSPSNQVMRIVNTCRTTAAGTQRQLNVFKLINQNVLEVSGSMPDGDKGFTDSVAITRPAELFMAIVKQRLESKGVTVTGQIKLWDRRSRQELPNDGPTSNLAIATLESPPFSVIAAKTMKPSQNMYTETILWTLGEEVGRRSQPVTNGRPVGPESWKLGLKVVDDFLKEIGIPDDGIIQYDGSGLSRHNLITPSAVVTLYTYMAKQSKNAQAWRDSLTIGGVDGTLRNRFKGTAAAGNIRGKTGTIDQVSALSGYMTTASGEQLVISILVNGVAVTRQRTSLIDDIVLDLANFNGKID